MSTASRLRAVEDRRAPIHLLRELTMPLVLAAVVVYLVIGMVTMDVPSNADFPGPRFFPAIIAGVMALLIVIQTVTAVRQWRAGTLVELGEDDDQRRQSDLVVEAGTRARLDVKALAWLVGSFAAFALLLEILGWVIAAGLLFWCIARAFGSRRHLLDLVVGLTVSSVAYIAFDMLLGLSLPSGILGWGF